MKVRERLSTLKYFFIFLCLRKFNELIHTHFFLLFFSLLQATNFIQTFEIFFLSLLWFFFSTHAGFFFAFSGRLARWVWLQNRNFQFGGICHHSIEVSTVKSVKTLEQFWLPSSQPWPAEISRLFVDCRPAQHLKQTTSEKCVLVREAGVCVSDDLVCSLLSIYNLLTSDSNFELDFRDSQETDKLAWRLFCLALLCFFSAQVSLTCIFEKATNDDLSHGAMLRCAMKTLFGEI